MQAAVAHVVLPAQEVLGGAGGAVFNRERVRRRVVDHDGKRADDVEAELAEELQDVHRPLGGEAPGADLGLGRGVADYADELRLPVHGCAEHGDDVPGVRVVGLPRGVGPDRDAEVA